MKILTYIYILLLTTLINGCSSSNQKEILEPQIKINKIPPKETHILKEKIDTKSIEKRENRKKKPKL
jgi:PBP1b-binding outer membrane lipoprotein LpoB